MTKYTPEAYPLPIHKTRWLLTTDDWYPCHEEGRVEASFIALRDGQFRVAVWGADDFGMERDFDSKEHAWHVFERLPLIVTQAELFAQGFVRA